METTTLSTLSWGALRLMLDAKLLRDEPPSSDPIVLALVDAGLCCGEIVWLDGERAWEYKITPAGRAACAHGQKI